jgi:hypothetical protein
MGDDIEGWIKTFFEGTWLVPGWNARSASLLDATPPAERTALGERLQRLGDRIAPEWAKDNGVRRIDNDDLERWGKALAAARRADGAALGAALERIEAEVASRIA